MLKDRDETSQMTIDLANGSYFSVLTDLTKWFVGPELPDIHGFDTKPKSGQRLDDEMFIDMKAWKFVVALLGELTLTNMMHTHAFPHVSHRSWG